MSVKKGAKSTKREDQLRVKPTNCEAGLGTKPKSYETFSVFFALFVPFAAILSGVELEWAGRRRFAMARPRRKMFKVAELGRDVGLAKSGAHPYRMHAYFTQLTRLFCLLFNHLVN
jgi:hypothetical protein